MNGGNGLNGPRGGTLTAGGSGAPYSENGSCGKGGGGNRWHDAGGGGGAYHSHYYGPSAAGYGGGANMSGGDGTCGDGGFEYGLGAKVDSPGASPSSNNYGSYGVGENSITSTAAGGGGGGNYGGGAGRGGWDSGGGGGGSGYCNTSLMSCSGQSGVKTGNGYAKISW